MTQYRDRARRWPMLAVAALTAVGLMAGPVAGATAAARGPSRSVPAPRADQWHRVDLLLIARDDSRSSPGFSCDGFASHNGACRGGLSTDKVDPPFNGGEATGRWIYANGGLNFGVFKSDDFLSGWLPSAVSDRFTVTSGHTNFSGRDNVVTGTENKPPGQQGGPLHIRVEEITNWTTLHLGYSFFVDGWVKVVPTTSVAQPSPLPGGRGRTVAVRAAGPAPSAALGPASVAEFFLGLAKDPAKNFILDQLGLPTTEQQLEQLKAKLDALDAHLSAVGQQLSTAIAQEKFDRESAALISTAVDLRTVYHTHLLPITDDLANLEKARKAGNQAQIDRYTALYNTHKQDFAGLSGAPFTSGVERIHDLLQPPLATTTGLLTALGDLMLTNHRYLTSADSAQLYDVYNYAQEYQALAAWETCEWAIATDRQTTLQAQIRDFETDLAQQHDQSRRGSLPPALAPGVVLDRGPLAAGQNPDSLNKLLLTYAPTYDAFWQEGYSPSPYSVPTVVAAANRSRLGGFGDWAVPTVDQLNSLLADRGSTSVRDRLNSVFAPLRVSGVTDFVWASNTVSQKVQFLFEKDPHGTTSYPVRYGLSLSNGAATLRPPNLSQTGRYRFRNEIDFAVRQPLGQVILARNTGHTRYF